MARVKRLPWNAISIGFTALLCVAFVVACIKVADAFRERDRAYTVTQVSQAKAESQARLTQEAQNTARVRVVACEQANLQSTATITGNVRGAVALLKVLAAGRHTPTLDARLTRGLYQYAVEQVHAHPPRDCTPSGLDRYFHQRPGTTAKALKGAP